MSAYVSTPRFDRFDLMLALAGTAPEVVDAFVENRMRGRLLDDIAAEEGVTRAAVHQRVQRAERAIKLYVERKVAADRTRTTHRDQLVRASR